MCLGVHYPGQGKNGPSSRCMMFKVFEDLQHPRTTGSASTESTEATQPYFVPLRSAGDLRGPIESNLRSIHIRDLVKSQTRRASATRSPGRISPVDNSMIGNDSLLVVHRSHCIVSSNVLSISLDIIVVIRSFRISTNNLATIPPFAIRFSQYPIADLAPLLQILKLHSLSFYDGDPSSDVHVSDRYRQIRWLDAILQTSGKLFFHVRRAA